MAFVATNSKSSLGTLLISLGCIWFVLAFFWLPPVALVLGSFNRWVRFPEIVYATVGRGEFVTSAAVLALGVLLRRRATRELSMRDYIYMLAGASIPVVGAFVVYGWMHLPY